MLRFNGKALEDRIQERGLDVRTVAKITGIQPFQLHAYIAGQLQPSCKSLVKLAWICMCDVNTFFTAGPATDRLAGAAGGR